MSIEIMGLLCLPCLPILWTEGKRDRVQAGNEGLEVIHYATVWRPIGGCRFLRTWSGQGRYKLWEAWTAEARKLGNAGGWTQPSGDTTHRQCIMHHS